MNEPGNCLGISLGTRRLGLAIGDKQGLTDWNIKAFDEEFSAQKVEKICRVIERVIERRNISIIGMKVAHKALRSKGLTTCLTAIVKLALEKDVVLYFYDIETMERFFLKAAVWNKEALSLCIADKYPELKNQYRKMQEGKTYYIKIFEAVAAMELALLEVL